MTKRQLRQWATVVILFLIVSGISYACNHLVKLTWHQLISYDTPYSLEPVTLRTDHAASARVVLVIIDSLRKDATRHMRSWHHLEEQGSSWDLQAALPSQNLPAWATLMTGTDPHVHGTATGFHTRPLPVDDMFSAAKRSQYTTVFAGNRDWEILFGGGVDRGRYQFAPQTEDRGPDQDWDSLEFILTELDSATEGFFVLNLTTLNQVALTSGAIIREDPKTPYMHRIGEYDEMLESLLRALDLSSDSILVVSSHGTTTRGAFGGPEPDVTDVAAVAAGGGIAPGTTASAHARDVAPTVAVLLGSGFPAHSTGLPVTAALELTEDETSELIASALASQLPFYQETLALLGSDVHLPHPDASEDSPEEVATSYRDAKALAITSRLNEQRRGRLPILALVIVTGLAGSALLWHSRYRRTMLLGLPLMLLTGFGIMYSMGARFSLTDIRTAIYFSLWYRGLRAQGFLTAIALGMMSGLVIARRGNYTRPQLFEGTLHTLATSMIALLLFAGTYLYLYGYEINWALPSQPLWIANYAAIIFVVTMGQAAILALGMSWLGAILTVHWWLD